ncbi:MAG: hypothetical protein DDT29_01196 [Dehalococcoidia bacterium]|nr:hypothetical protein [Bacillota bacterium]
MTGHAGGKGEGAAGSSVVVRCRGRPIAGGVINGDRVQGSLRQHHGDDCLDAILSYHVSSRVEHYLGHLIINYRQHCHRRSSQHGVSGIAQGEVDCLITFNQVIIQDSDGEGLTGHARGKDEGAADCSVVTRCRGRPIAGGVINGNHLYAGM